MNTIKLTLTITLLLIFSLNGNTQSDEIRSFMFGHSLMDHRPPAIPTPSDETTIPHWLFLLMEEAEKEYSATGQYGFLPQHANLPPFAQWGYDIVPGVWDSDNEPFSDADFNNVLITAGNFMQWQGPDVPIPGQGGMTVISATEDIVDWLELQEDTMGIYIYENWPDMAGYLNNGFPPTATEFDNYNTYTLGDFHNWWLDYHDALLASRPDLGIKMIPVGPILAELYSGSMLEGIPITELYEDDAPHGRATTYFLAGLITYTAICEAEAPASFVVPEIVHPTVRDNYGEIACFVLDYLLNFTDDSGNNRVYNPSAPLPVELVRFSGGVENNNINLTWETAVEINNLKFEIEESINGVEFSKIGEVLANLESTGNNEYHFVHQNPERGQHFYRLKQIDLDGSFEYSDIVTVAFYGLELEKEPIGFYPNPTTNGLVQLNYVVGEGGMLQMKIYDLNGTCLRIKNCNLEKGSNVLKLDLSDLGTGVFVIHIGEGEYGRVAVF